MAKDVPLPHEPHEPTLVVHDGVPYVVVPREDGPPCAFVAACSHKRLALVPLLRKKGALVCPHHGARFDEASGRCVYDAGKDVPEGLTPVDVGSAEDGGFVLHARKRHRKLLRKKARKRLLREASRA